jgi:predicted TIM-barrel fold metal-dependent hydrolase
MTETPWGEVAISDAHLHFFSHSFYESLAKQKNLGHAESLGPVLNWEIPALDPVALADRWVAELDRHGIQRASLIASVPGDERSVAAAVAAHPARFFGYFMLNPLQDDALHRVVAAGIDPNLHCVCLFPAMHGYSVNDERLQVVFQAAADAGLAVFVHCGALSVGVRSKLGLPCPFDLRFSNPLDLHKVAMRHPRTRFVIPHFGGGLFREALMLADLCPNVWLDTSSSNSWMKYEGLDLATVFRRAIHVVGTERLIFGTDSSFFPRGWNAGVLQAQLAALREADIDEAQAQAILGGNLERLIAGTGV